MNIITKRKTKRQPIKDTFILTSRKQRVENGKVNKKTNKNKTIMKNRQQENNGKRNKRKIRRGKMRKLKDRLQLVEGRKRRKKRRETIYKRMIKRNKQ